MSKGIRVGLLVKPLRIIAIILLVLAGRTFNANAQTVTNLYSFGGSASDGANPYAGLVQGGDGNFYGTTSGGGTNGGGTVFRISPTGTYTTLYSFVGSPSDGASPQAGLVQASDGNFYGTTYSGGTSNAGTVFRISPSGSNTNLHSFGVSPSDGAYPQAGLVQASDGNFYGTTYSGGTNDYGTVFRITPTGSYTNLHWFVGYPDDGRYPGAGLVQGSDGYLYGTTEYGGTINIPDIGDGSVFQISLNGSLVTAYSFGAAPNDGVVPSAALVQGSDGNFYGTTIIGGTTGNGTVFRISPTGTYTNLYSFAGFPNDGASPYAPLVQGSDGNFYGTTRAGGAKCGYPGCGTVFRISPSDTYTNLYSFAGYASDGSYPAGLVQGSDGNFYGTTRSGGTNDEGTVFKLTVPLNPPPYPINQITSVHVAVTNIIFTIPSIAGETYQLQYRNSLTSGSWSNIPGVSVTNSIGSILTLTNFAGAAGSQEFYRFAITP